MFSHVYRLVSSNNIVSKIAIIGIIIAVAIGIGITASSISMNDENNVDTSNQVDNSEEVAVVEEEIEEISEETGKDLSVELTESIGLKTP